MNDLLLRRFVKARACDLSQPADYLRLLAQQLGDMGIDASEWLRRGGIAPDALDHPELAVAVPVFRRLVADALRRSGDPALGLLVGQRMAIHSHAALGEAARRCRSLREVLYLLEHYIALRTPLVSVRCAARADEVRVMCRERLVLGDIRRPVLEAIVLALKNMLDFLALGDQPVRAVAFAFDAPPYVALARDIWQCEQRYGSRWTGLAIPADRFEKPLRLRRAGDFQRAAAACSAELGRLALRETYGARVRRLLLEQGTGGFPSLPTTARLLNLTPRTLHRHLEAEGTSYRALLDDIRLRLALQHLRSGRLGVEETAWALGYSDPANFRRAFRRWTGGPPSAATAERQ